MGSNLERLRRIKLSVVLPPTQLFVAIALWEWARYGRWPRALDAPYYPTPWLVARGINGPAVPFHLLGRLLYRMDYPPPSILGFDPEQLCFFAGVVILWHLVGRALDKCKYSEQKTPEQELMSRGRVALSLLAASWGIVMLVAGLQSLRQHLQYGNSTGNVAQGILFLVWSLVLMILPALKFVGGIRF